MSQRKTRSKKASPRSNSLGKEILAALAEFTVALEKGDVGDHLQKRQAKVGVAPANYKPGDVKKLRTSPKGNGKWVRV